MMSVQGKNIIIVGDSHSDQYSFGDALEQGLEDSGAIVTRLAIGGTDAKSWLKGKVCRGPAMGKPAKCQSLADVAGQKFDFALITLGTNDAANMDVYVSKGQGTYATRMKWAVEQIQAVAEKVAPTFIWVGPPPVSGKLKHYTQRAMDELYDAAYAEWGSDVIIDSRKLVPKHVGDGVHLAKKEGKAHAAAVVEQLNEMVSGGSGGGLLATSSGKKPIWPVVLVLALVIGGVVWKFGKVPRPVMA